jgi:hypothetical protein
MQNYPLKATAVGLALVASYMILSAFSTIIFSLLTMIIAAICLMMGYSLWSRDLKELTTDFLEGIGKNGRLKNLFKTIQKHIYHDLKKIYHSLGRFFPDESSTDRTRDHHDTQETDIQQPNFLHWLWTLRQTDPNTSLNEKRTHSPTP